MTDPDVEAPLEEMETESLALPPGVVGLVHVAGAEAELVEVERLDQPVDRPDPLHDPQGVPEDEVAAPPTEDDAADDRYRRKGPHAPEEEQEETYDPKKTQVEEGGDYISVK